MLVGIVFYPGHCRAEVTTTFDGATWSTIVDPERFFAVVAHPENTPTDVSQNTTVLFYFAVKDKRFWISVRKETLVTRTGETVPLVIAFKSNSPGKPLLSLRLLARVETGTATAPLSDADVAVWTHGFTAGTVMTVAFPTQDAVTWTYNLAGTTPAISAMASAIGAAGINGLPPPWQMDGYGAAPPPTAAVQSPVQQSSPAVPDAETERRQLAIANADAQRRQLAIANAEAEKAKADAIRATADAAKARADADRAQAEANIVQEEKAQAAEQARVKAIRQAAESRQKAEQAKAEDDAKGTEP